MSIHDVIKWRTAFFPVRLDFSRTEFPLESCAQWRIIWFVSNIWYYHWQTLIVDFDYLFLLIFDLLCWFSICSFWFLIWISFSACFCSWHLTLNSIFVMRSISCSNFTSNELFNMCHSCNNLFHAPKPVSIHLSNCIHHHSSYI